MDERARLIIELLGADTALNTLKDLENAQKRLEGQKTKITVDIADAEKQLAKLTQDIKDWDSLLKQVGKKTDFGKQIQEEISALKQAQNAQKAYIDAKNADLDIIKAAISGTKTLTQERSKYEKEYTKQYEANLKAREKAEQAAQKAAEQAEKHRQQVAQAQARYEAQQSQAAQKAADDYVKWWTKALDEVEAKRQESIANAWRGVFSAIGTASDISSMTSSFASGIGNAFSSMASLFDTNFIKVAQMKLTAMLTEAFVGHSDQVMKRADIMNTFSQYMSLTGVTASESEKALQRVNESILGLPIGLDESAQRLRRYQMFLGDLDRATNITIGLQKAITAGGASDSMKNLAYYQIDRLLSAGQLNTSRQWYSLINGLGVSMRFLSEAMEVGDISVNQLADGLAKGKYTSDQLLDALARLGEGTSEAAQELDQALNIYKSTYESWLKNIEFAMVRGGERIVKAFDSVLVDTTGTSIVQYMEKTRNALNTMYAGVADFITGNPESITRMVGSLTGLFEAVQRIQFSDIGTGIIENLARVIDMMTTALSKVTGGKLEKFVSFATTIAAPMGAVFKAMSSGLPILMAIFDRFRTFNFEMLIDKLMVQAQKLANVVTYFLDMFDDESMANILAYGLTWGSIVGKMLTSLSTGLMALSRTPMGAQIFDKFVVWSAGLKNSHPVFAATASSLGKLAIALGAVFAVYKTSEAIDNANTKRIRRALGLDVIDEYIEKSNKAVETSKTTYESLNSTFETSIRNADKAKELVDKIKELDAATLDENGISEMTRAVSELSAILPEVTLNIDPLTGHLDAQSKAALDNASAIDQLVASMKRLAAQEATQDSYRQIWSLEGDIQEQDIISRNLTAQMDGVRRQMQYIRSQYPSMFNSDGTFNGSARNLNNSVYTEYSRLSEQYNFLESSRNASLSTRQKLNEEMAKYEAQIKRFTDLYEEQTKAEAEASKASQEYIDKKMAEASAVDTTSGAIDRSSDSYKNMLKAAHDSIDEQIKLFDDLTEAVEANTEAKKKAIESQAEVLGQYEKNLKIVTDYLSQTGDEGLIALLGKMGEDYEQNTFEYMGGIASIAEMISNGTLQAYINSLKETEIQAGKTESAVADMNATIASLTVPEEPIKFSESLFPDEIDVMENWQTRAQNIHSLYDEMVSARRNIQAETKGIADDIDEGLGEAADKAEEQSGRIVTGFIGIPSVISSTAIRVGSAIASFASAFSSSAIETTISSFWAKVQSALNIGFGLRVPSISLPTVHVGSSGTTHGGSGGRIPRGAGRFSTGGVVYASGGMFIPRGTDTVPAMLTPGEFVINRAATSKIGADILARINRMDFAGAFDAMVNKFSQPRMGQYVTQHVSNSDSHNRNTMNVYTQNPQFAMRIASRYI